LTPEERDVLMLPYEEAVSLDELARSLPPDDRSRTPADWRSGGDSGYSVACVSGG
jgi:hypothetical protein